MTGGLRTRRRERGHLLVWAAVFGVLAMAYWAMAFRTTADCIRAERAATLRAARDESPARALAAAVALLRTGTPASSPYTCILTPSGASACVVTYTQDPEDSERWSVATAVATDDDLVAHPTAPEGF